MTDGPGRAILRRQILKALQAAGKLDLESFRDFAELVRPGMWIRVDQGHTPVETVSSILDEAKKHNKSEQEVLEALAKMT